MGCRLDSAKACKVFGFGCRRFDSDPIGTMIIFNTSRFNPQAGTERASRPFYPSELGSMGSGSTLMALHGVTVPITSYNIVGIGLRTNG